jgi:hypothetical protein
VIRRVAAILPLAAFAASATPAAAQIHTNAPQFLPIPGVTATEPGLAPSAPLPLAPPINPGYAPAVTGGLSPILTEPAGPLAEYPQPRPSTAYPAPQLPGPIDQQKMTAYRNDLLAQQWQSQGQGQSLASTQRGREILQQLNQPDMQ